MKTDLLKFFQSKTFKLILWLITGLIILLLVFWTGVMVGFKKANFSYRWGENYQRNFAGPRGGFFKEMRRDFGNRDFGNPHGIFGQVIKIDGQVIIVRGQDNVEKNILVQTDTIINRFREQIKITDLKVDDAVVIIGEPNEAGQVVAKLIRVMPPQPNFGLPPVNRPGFENSSTSQK